MNLKQLEEANWIERLEWLIQYPEEVTHKHRYLVWNKSGDWPTCACGELCKTLPKSLDGAPLDHELCKLGFQFHNAVAATAWPEALEIFLKIENQTGLILAEQNNEPRSI